MDAGALAFNGQLIVAIPIALLAGLVSFASPCVLPIVPGYLGYVSGLSDSSRAGRSRMLLGVSLFILGFSVIFVAYGLAFGALGGWLLHYQAVISRVAGVIVILMGLIFIGFFGFLVTRSTLISLNASPEGSTPIRASTAASPTWSSARA